MEKWINPIAKGIGIAVLVTLVVVMQGLIMSVGILGFDLFYQNCFKTHLQTLEAPGKNMKFVLMTDLAGVGDRSWYVYKSPVVIDVIQKVEMRIGHNTDGVLFWNYSETGDHSDNAKLEILKGKYLVFSRGGLYHSLYDIDTGQVLVNEENPFVAWLCSEEDENSPELMRPQNMKTTLDSWVRKNLHAKIEKILNDIE
ncbi:MAG: hypothetical protein M1269_13770 [Chloroflexi bacterium]|nr:hypothetical protein [Chloroflexota bacterium]